MSRFFKKLFGGAKSRQKAPDFAWPMKFLVSDSIEEDMVKLAAITVEKYGGQSNDTLDYSPASMKAVEAILSNLSNEPFEYSNDEINEIVVYFSAYIFETARREFGGKYKWWEMRNQPLLVVGEPEFSVGILAGDKVCGRLFGDTADNIPFFYEGFLEHARRAEPGSRATIV